MIVSAPDWILARIAESPGHGGAPFPVPAFPSLHPEAQVSTEEGCRAIDRAVETLRKAKDGMRNAVLFNVCASLGDLAYSGDVSLRDARGAIETFLHMENWRDAEKTLDTMERGFVKGANKERCMVIIGTNHEDCNTQAIVGLSRRDDVYVIGNSLSRDTGSGISAVNNHNLREILSECVDWRDRGKEGVLKRAHPPEWAIGEVHSRGHWTGIRVVTGFARTPVLRPDGTVAASMGWDPVTGVVLGETWDEVPIPLEAAKSFLAETFEDFPFETPAHLGALMCALLTPLAVHAFSGPIPLFFFDASVAGAGKGKMASVCGIIATGEVPKTTTYKESEEEMRKYITTCAKNPKPIIFFDNVEGEFGGSVLCSVLTSADRMWNDRILGGNTEFSGTLNSVIYATGNNATLGPDMERRVVPIRIVPGVERPELRNDFRHPDLMAWVQDNRKVLTWCALTLLRGYIAAGRPFEGRAWGSYEAWSRLIVGCVVWAGFASPVGAVEAMRAGTDRLNEGAMLVAACSGMGEFTAKEAHDLAYPKGVFMGGALEGGKRLRDMLDDLYPEPKKCTVLQLACLLRKYKGRIFDGAAVQEKGKRQNLITWGVASVSSKVGSKKR